MALLGYDKKGCEITLIKVEISSQDWPITDKTEKKQKQDLLARTRTPLYDQDNSVCHDVGWDSNEPYDTQENAGKHLVQAIWQTWT